MEIKLQFMNREGETPPCADAHRRVALVMEEQQMVHSQELLGVQFAWIVTQR